MDLFAPSHSTQAWAQGVENRVHAVGLCIVAKRRTERKIHARLAAIPTQDRIFGNCAFAPRSFAVISHFRCPPNDTIQTPEGFLEGHDIVHIRPYQRCAAAAVKGRREPSSLGQSHL
jgi:hypothetical protein